MYIKNVFYISIFIFLYFDFCCVLLQVPKWTHELIHPPSTYFYGVLACMMLLFSFPWYVKPFEKDCVVWVPHALRGTCMWRSVLSDGINSVPPRWTSRRSCVFYIFYYFMKWRKWSWLQLAEHENTYFWYRYVSYGQFVSHVRTILTNNQSYFSVVPSSKQLFKRAKLLFFDYLQGFYFDCLISCVRISNANFSCSKSIPLWYVCLVGIFSWI